MAHSNQLREFVLTNTGVHLVPAYLGPGGVLTGSSRLAQEAHEKSEARSRQQEADRKKQELDSKRLALKAQIALLQAEFSAAEREAEEVSREYEEREEALECDRRNMAKSRASLQENVIELQATQGRADS
jgi:circadian clock protein KaiC